MTARVVSTAPQGSPEWLQLRRNSLGGSDVGAILGHNPWTSPIDVWLSKQDDHVDQPTNEAMQWGHRLEPVVRRHFQRENPDVVVDEVPGILAHPTRPWMAASLDGLIHGKDSTRVLEIKTSRRPFDELPQMYLAQVLWYCGVTSLESAVVACLFSGSTYREFTVDVDPVGLRDMADYAEAWWDRHVVGGVMPPPDPVKDAPKLSRLWQAEPGLVQEIPDDVALLLRRRRLALDTAKREYDEVVAEAQLVMREATVAESEGVRVATWSATKPRTTVDTARLKADGLFDEYSKTGDPGRMFRLDSKWLEGK